MIGSNWRLVGRGIPVCKAGREAKFRGSSISCFQRVKLAQRQNSNLSIKPHSVVLSSKPPSNWQKTGFDSALAKLLTSASKLA